MYSFHSSSELVKLAKKHKKPIWEIVLLNEMSSSDKTRKQIVNKMSERITVMKEAVNKGLKLSTKSVGGMVGTNAIKLSKGIQKKQKDMMMSKEALLSITYAISTSEMNARMGRIVAFPTAGAAGVIPGVFLAAQKKYKFSDKKLTEGLFTASGMGMIIGENATLAGAEGGCQAEIGAAVAMAAAALTEMRGGTPDQCMHAASLGLKNLLGLTCDPLGGMVEVPCVKRGGILSVLALSASDMAI
ncbi:L-serine ammonia-lyase, iron-sulfur-dependent, subunit alpha, partial [Candidatus Peregrinibacteria bacterium]|nr:L-serine ammonia-lyase, iron-sulfur-dependent, subunit alpha [Candidatus Peregrinibacteria bacterium]